MRWERFERETVGGVEVLGVRMEVGEVRMECGEGIYAGEFLNDGMSCDCVGNGGMKGVVDLTITGMCRREDQRGDADAEHFCMGGAKREKHVRWRDKTSIARFFLSC